MTCSSASRRVALGNRQQARARPRRCAHIVRASPTGFQWRGVCAARYSPEPCACGRTARPDSRRPVRPDVGRAGACRTRHADHAGCAGRQLLLGHLKGRLIPRGTRSVIATTAERSARTRSRLAPLQTRAAEPSCFVRGAIGFHGTAASSVSRHKVHARHACCCSPSRGRFAGAPRQRCRASDGPCRARSGTRCCSRHAQPLF